MNNIGAGFLAIMVLFGPSMGYALGMWIVFKIIKKSDEKYIEKYKNEEKGRQ